MPKSLASSLRIRRSRSGGVGFFIALAGPAPGKALNLNGDIGGFQAGLQPAHFINPVPIPQEYLAAATATIRTQYYLAAHSSSHYRIFKFSKVASLANRTKRVGVVQAVLAS